MKKLFILFAVTFLIVIASVSAFASDDIGPLSDLGIFEEEVYSEKYVTINELCRITSKLMNPSDIAPINEDDAYSGYVYTMKSNGLISYDTDGEMYATGEDVSKLYLYAMGYYNAAVSTQKSFTSFLMNLGIAGSSGIIAEADVTYRMLAEITHNALEKPLADITLSENGNINTTLSQKRTILQDVYEVNVYEGTINHINYKPLNATVEITRNVYNENKVIIPPGSNVSFRLSNRINPYELENAPAVMWVIDNEIISAYVKNNVEVKFAVISSVNADENENNAYVPHNISKIMLYDDKKEYKIDNNFKVKSDGVIKGDYDAVKLIGKYVRVVFVDNKISFIEAWSFNNDSLITEIEKTTTDTIIHYTDKTTSNKKFKKLNEYENIKVIINGTYSDVSLLKPYSVFSWCIYNDVLVIAVNEQVISASLNSVSDKYIELGNMEYLKADTLYYSKDSKRFESDSNGLFNLIKNDVSAYFNVKNEVVYILPVKGSALNGTSFIGLATGYLYEAFENERFIEVLDLEGENGRKAYRVKDKAKLEDTISYTSIETAINLDDGTAIYEFEVNDNSEIISIKNAYTYKGVGTHGFSLSRLSTNITYATFTASDGTVMYVDGTPIVVVYKDEKEKYTKKEESWVNLYGKNASGSKAYVYGYTDSSDPRLIVIVGKTQDLSNYETMYGVMTKKSVVLDEYGEKCYKINVITNQNEQEYTLPFEEGEKLPKTAYINFRNNFRYDPKRTIKITSYIDLTGSFDSWEMTGFTDAYVELTGSNSFTTTSGKTCFLHPYYCFVAVYDNGNITKGDMSDISAGNRIYYFYTEGDTRIIFVEK